MPTALDDEPFLPVTSLDRPCCACAVLLLAMDSTQPLKLPSDVSTLSLWLVPQGLHPLQAVQAWDPSEHGDESLCTRWWWHPSGVALLTVELILGPHPDEPRPAAFERFSRRLLTAWDQQGHFTRHALPPGVDYFLILHHAGAQSSPPTSVQAFDLLAASGVEPSVDTVIQAAAQQRAQALSEALAGVMTAYGLCPPKPRL